MLYCTTNILFVSTRPMELKLTTKCTPAWSTFAWKTHIQHTCTYMLYSIYSVFPNDNCSIALVFKHITIIICTYIHAPKSLVCIQQQMNVLLYPIPCFIVRIEFMNYLSMTHRVPSLLISFFGCVSTFNIFLSLSLFFCMYNVHVLRFFLPFPLFLLGVVLFVISHKLQHTHSHWRLDKNNVSLHWLVRLFSNIY